MRDASHAPQNANMHGPHCTDAPADCKEPSSPEAAYTTCKQKLQFFASVPHHLRGRAARRWSLDCRGGHRTTFSLSALHMLTIRTADTRHRTAHAHRKMLAQGNNPANNSYRNCTPAGRELPSLEMWAAANSGYTVDDGCNRWMTLQRGEVCTAHIRGGQEGVTRAPLSPCWTSRC